MSRISFDLVISGSTNCLSAFAAGSSVNTFVLYKRTNQNMNFSLTFLKLISPYIIAFMVIQVDYSQFMYLS
jgi:hypothetical protein